MAIRRVGEREREKEGTVQEEEDREGEQVQGGTKEEQIHKDEQNKEKGRKQREFILVFQNGEKEIGEVLMSLTQKYYIQRYLLTVVHVSCQNDCLASVVTYVQYYHVTEAVNIGT